MLKKNSFNKLSRFSFYLLFCLICNSLKAQQLSAEFIHPGVLHTLKDFQEMKEQVKNHNSDAYQGFLILNRDPRAQSDYQMIGPFQVISRDGKFAYTKSKMEADFSAAYLNSVMWMLTGDVAHAQKSLAILIAYADSLQKIPATNDAPLLAGLEGFKIIYAAELLKYTFPKITVNDNDKIAKMLKLIFLPVLDKFYATPAYTNGNWGPIVSRTYMAAGIYLNDPQMYQTAKQFYLHAHDNGTIEHYIDGNTGQIQESGRDQGHCQLGLGAMATLCEVAYKQGDDLYSALNNRLLKGFEYVARYNLGENVPFTMWKDVTGKYSNWDKISAISRGRLIPIYQMVYHHYHDRKALPMPFTKRVIEKMKTEGFDRDQPAFGHLLFADQLP